MSEIRHERTLEDVISTIEAGEFYQDYDQSTADLGILRAARSGGLKPLDEDDYEDIVNAATIRMRKAMSGARGQMITVQDGLDWWIMKETESRILAALNALDKEQP